MELSYFHISSQIENKSFIKNNQSNLKNINNFSSMSLVTPNTKDIKYKYMKLNFNEAKSKGGISITIMHA